MTAHLHSTHVPGCYRCDLSRDEEVSARPSSESLPGPYVADPLLPAGEGWCEAIIGPRWDTPGGRYCYTKARFERDGRRVCGLHRRAGPRRWGVASGGDGPDG